MSKPILYGIITSILGIFLGGVGGFLGGFAIGYLFGVVFAQRDRIDVLEMQLDRLTQAARQATPPPDAAVAAAPVPTEPSTAPAALPAEPRPELEMPAPAPEPEPVLPRATDVEPVFAPPPPMPPPPVPPVRPPLPEPEPEPEREPLADLLAPIRAFFLGGNTLVRAGIVVLFFGFAFLVKYAVDNDYFPLELRLAAAAAGGTVLAAIGWRLRERRPDVGLALQGGGAAVLYLVIFAAGRLYGLVPMPATFGLLVAVTGFCATLALLQNAQSLAVLALLGGFFAPVLASTGQGSHVVLFGYFAVLNAGVVALAWFKPWRPLFLIGFFCTFGIAGQWGYALYRPELLPTTEPFLLLFFLAYFAVSMLNTRHGAGRGERLADGTLVFGLPVVVFSMQSVLVRHVPYGMAWSALGFGAFYAAVAYALWRRDPARLRTLVESFAGIGLVLGSLILPFALDATWTGTGWALEGAALVWLGYRQRRWLLRASGALLQVVAMATFITGDSLMVTDTIPVLNRFAFGALAFAVSAFATAYLAFRHREDAEAPRWEALLAPLFLLLAVLWWALGGLLEIGRQVPADEQVANACAAYLALSALGAAALRRRLAWPALRRPAGLLVASLVLVLPLSHWLGHHTFAGYGFLAWPVALAASALALRLLDADLGRNRAAFFAFVWHMLLAGVLASEWSWGISWLAPDRNVWPQIALRQLAPKPTVWPQLALGLIPAALALAVTEALRTRRWPYGTRPWECLYGAAAPLLAVALAWSLFATFNWPADPAPLPYVPLLNPLDLTLGLLVIAGLTWWRAVARTLPADSAADVRAILGWALAASVFAWVNAAIGRTVHFYGDVPYYIDDLFASSAFQTAITIFWTATAVVAMAVAARRKARLPWVAAASLLGLTVVKLFAVDLSSIGTVPRIFTFLVVGVLLLLVGYLAPVPPPRHRDVETPA